MIRKPTRGRRWSERSPLERTQELLWLAQTGDPDAQLVVGRQFLEGDEVIKDTEEAFRWIERAADQGHALALSYLGTLHILGNGPDGTDYQAAARCFRLALENGAEEAAGNLGMMFATGVGGLEDHPERYRWLAASAGKGDAWSCYKLGRAHLTGADGAVEVDGEKAEKWLTAAADAGVAMAAWELSLAFRRGRVLPRDKTRSAEWLRRAAEGNWPPAQAELGRRYATGKGVRKSLEEAARLYRKAAEQDYSPGQYMLALQCLRGKGVPRSVAKGAKWMVKSAEAGFPPAQMRVAVLCFLGIGMPRSWHEGVKWVRTAARTTRELQRRRRGDG